MTPDYYYGEMLRWSFGFENPNKAAVVFACLIPLLWAGWLGAFGLGSTRWKVSCSGLAALGFLAAWTCLLLTFSRGGLLAAFAGMGVVTVWLIFQKNWGGFSGLLRNLKAPATWLSAGLVSVISAAAIFLGMGSRSLEALGEDASVGNRLELWSAALQMTCENPAGFGPGRSGSEFVHWYQAVDRTEGYRTMVNSYLTFLVEMGWLPFVSLMVAVAAFWAWTWPRGGEKCAVLRTAAWASLAAFLASGIFSTTMEEPLVWVIPGLVVVALFILRFRSGPWNLSLPRTGCAVGCAIMMLAALFGMGQALSKRDLLERQFARDETGNLTVASIRPKSKVDQPAIRVFPDEIVLGPDWGKLMRVLAIQTGREVRVLDAPNDADKAFDVMVIGSAGPSDTVPTDGRVVLIAPSIRDLRLEVVSMVILPEIDEDGRISFWQERVQDAATEPPQVVTLDGVGTRIDWAWNQVIEVVNGL